MIRYPGRLTAKITIDDGIIAGYLREYIGNHPEVMTEDAKIVISVHSTPTDEQTFAKIQSMIDASLEKLKTTLKLQLEQGQPEDASGPSEKDLDDMLKNLDIFNL